MRNVWTTLPRPIIVLAPLADVTDAAFRRIIAEHSGHRRADGSWGGPDVFWTEFVSADGLARADEAGRARLLRDLWFTEAERPIVAQLFTSEPAHMEAAAALCRELGFDGVDINTGCPDRTVERQGAGAALIRDPARAREVIQAAKRGARHGDADGIPVSVKTRLGYNQDELEHWLPELLAEAPAVVTIHARTRKEMSNVPARWERIARAVQIRDMYRSDTLIFGNGDVPSVQAARALAARTGADGVMLGRALFGNPWLFHPTRDLHNVPLSTRLRTMVAHTELFAELFPDKSFATMKKHYKAYVNGFTGAKELRMRLMEAPNAAAVREITDAFLRATPDNATLARPRAEE